MVVAACHWDWESRYTPIWKGWGVWSGRGTYVATLLP